MGNLAAQFLCLRNAHNDTPGYALMNQSGTAAEIFVDNFFRDFFAAFESVFTFEALLEDKGKAQK